MNNNVVDKIYVALELTKVRYDKGSEYTSDENVLETFNHYVKELTGLENIHEFFETKEKLEEYKIEYDRLVKNIDERVHDLTVYKFNQIREFIQTTKGDMEPYVYEELTKMIS